jgi:hypothetical protein
MDNNQSKETQWRFGQSSATQTQRAARRTELEKEAMPDVKAIGLKSNLTKEQHNYLHPQCPDPEPTSARDTVNSLHPLYFMRILLGDLPRVLNHAYFLTTTYRELLYQSLQTLRFRLVLFPFTFSGCYSTLPV